MNVTTHYCALLFFIVFLQTFILSTKGLSISGYEQNLYNLTILGEGFKDDKTIVTVKVANIHLPTILQISNNKMVVQIPINVKNGVLTVQVGGDTKDYNNLLFKPIIDSIIPTGGVISPNFGGTCLIIGNLFNVSSNSFAEFRISGVLNSLQCNVVGTNNIGAISYMCTIPPGYGTKNLTVVLEGVTSDPFLISYSPPIINYASDPIYNSLDPITIYGVNFQNGSFDLTTVQIDNVTCEIVSSNIQEVVFRRNNSILPTVFNGGFQGSLAVSTHDVFFKLDYLKPTITNVFESNGTLTLKLVNFKWSFTRFIMNGLDLGNYCKATSSSLICELPDSIKSGTSYLRMPANEVEKILYFSPFINSPSLNQVISNIPTSGGNVITLKGKHFDKYIFDENSTLNNLEIIYRNESFINYVLVNNTYMTFTIPEGSGGYNTLYVRAFMNTTQNPFIISYGIPVINSIITKSNNKIEIIGTNFGSDKSKITLNYGGVLIDEDFEIIEPHTKITFNLTGQLLGTSCKVFIITVDGLSSIGNSIIIKPQITSLSTLSINGGELEFYGYGFLSKTIDQFELDWELDLSIEISIKAINCSSITTNHAKCVYPPLIFTDGFKVKLKVGNQSSNLFESIFYTPIMNSFNQIGNQFIIHGSSFSDIPNRNVVYLNGNPYPVSSDSNNTILYITFPSNSIDGTLYSVSSGMKSPVSNFLLNPLIHSISSKPYVDGSSVITIFGSYLHSSNTNFYFSSTSSVFSPTKNVTLPCTLIEPSFNYLCSFTEKGFGNATIIANKTTLDGLSKVLSNILQISFQEPKIIESTSLFYNSPGLINITVESYSSDSLQVFISNSQCLNPIEVSKNLIQCYFKSDVPLNSNNNEALEITVISNEMGGKNQVFLYFEKLECPNNCTSSNNGICNIQNGQCTCFKEWQSKDCSQIKQIDLPPPLITDNGETILNGGDLNFTISISHLREVDFNGNQIKLLQLSDIKWINNTKITSSKSYFNGMFNNDTVNIELDVIYYKTSQDFIFAGDVLSIPSNSIKYIITISNWNFSSPLNNLEIIYNSKTKLIYENECGEIKKSSYNSNDNNGKESITWFQINSGNSIMDSIFSRRMFVDDKVRISSVSLLSNTDPLYKQSNSDEDGNDEYYNRLVAIKTPYFTKSIKLDPSFSSLLQPTEESSCSSNRTKIILISVLCSVVGCAILVALSILLFKKYLYVSRNPGSKLIKLFIVKKQ